MNKRKRIVKEERMISEFIKDLDLSDARVRKRLVIDCSREKLFQTEVGNQFLKDLYEGKVPDSLHNKSFRWKKEIAVICTGVFLITGICIGNQLPFLRSNRGYVKQPWAVAGTQEYQSMNHKQLEIWNPYVENPFLYQSISNKENGMLWNEEYDLITNQISITLRFEQLYQQSINQKMKQMRLDCMSESEIIPSSDSQIVSNERLNRLTKDQLCLSLYEIYARHGRRFYDNNLQEYFNSKSWYQAIQEGESFTDAMLNECERSNIIAIKEMMDRYEDENNTAYDYSSLTIDDMKEYLEEILRIQKSYLYSFTMTDYYQGRLSLEECYQRQMIKLNDMLRFNVLGMSIDSVTDPFVRAMFYHLLEAGYIIDGQCAVTSIGAI